MNAVIEHGTPLVDDPDRIGVVRQLGVDETSFLAANRHHATIYATGLVDLERHVVIDMVAGNAAADLRRWTANADPAWLAGDQGGGHRSGRVVPRRAVAGLTHARRVADPFHVVRVGNRCVDQVRRRVQNDTLGHRGRKADPLYRIRKLLLTGSERLDERGRDRMLLGLRVGDPNDELLGAWLAKESVRDVYLADTPADAATLLDKAIAGCSSRRRAPRSARSARPSPRGAPRSSPTTTPAPPTVRPRASTCASRRSSAAATASAPSSNYRLRVLLHAGGITWPERPTPPRIRTRAPHSNA